MSVVFEINPDDRFDEYTATADQTVFAISFPFQDNRDLTISQISVAGVESALTIATHYTLSGAGESSGGQLTLVTGAAVGEKIRIRGNAVLDRLGSITQGGKFGSALSDDEHDRHRLIQQELQRETSRALKVDFGVAELLPLPAASAGKALIWNDDGNGLENGPDADDIASAETYAEAAAEALASFYQAYLLSQASEPTETEDGEDLAEGMLYWDSATNVMKVFNGANWEAAYVAGAGFAALSGAAFTGPVTFNTYAALDVSDIGVSLHGYDADLDALTAFAATLLDDESAAEARATLELSTITDAISGLIETPDETSYTLVIKAPFSGTITETVTKSTSGTCTATFKINSTALGGTANSVSTSEQAQAHASDNEFSADDDIVLTVSSNSSCEFMSFTIKFTRALS